jgi:cadmium resistance protein CadD (predicted permease)
MVDECKEVKVIVTGGNDWSIVAKKFFYGLIATFASVGIPYTVQFLENEDLTGLPLWFIGLVPIITGILLAIQNAWTHREKIEYVKTEIPCEPGTVPK